MAAVERRGLLHLAEHHPHLDHRLVAIVKRSAVEPQDGVGGTSATHGSGTISEQPWADHASV
jgi:hypothetical protein